ncbi:hypothetical protein F5Y14DRAFT_126886 [Nemania sp. NC0429]|nr:hypothetical protein F5Y14DRAFT_126886 [Nemania sp. NC0429]
MDVISTSFRYIYPTRTTSNYGPLTATFTPAPSCANATNAVIFGYLDNYYATSRGFDQSAYPTCSIQPYDGVCFPSADRWNADNSDLFKTTTPVLHFYSPGIYCPESWTDVGRIVSHTPNADNSPNVTGSGAIASNMDYQSIVPPSNTLVMCCPDNFTGDRSGGCYSALPSTTAPDGESVVSVCVYPTPTEDITTVFATTSLGSTSGSLGPEPLWYVTQEVSVTELQKIEPQSTALPTAAASPFTYVPAVMLVHAPSDMPNAGTPFADARSAVYSFVALCVVVGVLLFDCVA